MCWRSTWVCPMCTWPCLLIYFQAKRYTVEDMGVFQTMFHVYKSSRSRYGCALQEKNEIETAESVSNSVAIWKQRRNRNGKFPFKKCSSLMILRRNLHSVVIFNDGLFPFLNFYDGNSFSKFQIVGIRVANTQRKNKTF